MKNRIGLAIVFLAIVCIFSPVAAWHADVTLSGPEKSVCPTCDFYSYTISANSGVWPEYILRVNDTLPAGLEYVPGSSIITGTLITEPGYHVEPQWDLSTRTLTWDFYKVDQMNFRNVTFNVRPTGLSSVDNRVETRVMPTIYWESARWGQVVSETVTTTFSADVCPIVARDPVPVPEFPTLALPAGLIAGLLGVTLIIKRTKEN
ncbi:MAG: hypothetical protein M0Q91_10665 [Methanoregula sp.]|nr:hypothetical protein [Methanoregula sp.]